MSISNTNITNIGSAGTVLANGANGPTWTVTAATPAPALTVSNNTVSIDDKTTLEVKGRVKINGEYLDERLERIETVLQIPTRNIDMENKYPKLKKLYEEYTKELAKYKTWETLKESK